MTLAETKSYSQQDEQRYILEAVGGTIGRFLDIGAWHPTCFSNTRALYERGWSGVMVEPSPGPFASLLAEYGNDPRITLVQAAIGLERKLAEFWVSDDAVSTTERDQYEKWKDAAKFIGKYYVSQLLLKDIAYEFGRDFDFLSIDAEGRSVDLLFEFLGDSDFKRPRAICVEHDGMADEVKRFCCDGFGYRVAMEDNGTNLVFGR